MNYYIFNKKSYFASNGLIFAHEDKTNISVINNRGMVFNNFWSHTHWKIILKDYTKDIIKISKKEFDKCLAKLREVDNIERQIKPLKLLKKIGNLK